MRGTSQDVQARPVLAWSARDTVFPSCEFRSRGLGWSQRLFLNAIAPRQYDKFWMSSRCASFCCVMLPADVVMKQFEITWGTCFALSRSSVQCRFKLTRVTRMALLSYGSHQCRCPCLACTHTSMQSRAKKRLPDFTVLHNAVVAFEACGDLDSQSLTGLMDSALTACMAHYHFS